MAQTKPTSKIDFSSQETDNLGFDTEFNIPLTEPTGYDGQNMQRMLAQSMNLKVVEDGSYTYIAQAAPGTSETTAKWKVYRVDESVAGTTKILYANGSADFDQQADDIENLTYS